jgi:hypothetical protein
VDSALVTQTGAASGAHQTQEVKLLGETTVYGPFAKRGLECLSVMLLGLSFLTTPVQGQSPSGVPAPQPDARVEVAFWESILHTANPEEFRIYLERWPDGIFADLARLRLAALENAVSQPLAVPALTSPQADVSFYENPRFGTRVRFPAGQFSAQLPSGNDDAGRFLTSDGMAGFLVFGQHDLFHQSPEQALGAALRDGGYDQIRSERVVPGGYEFIARQGNRLVHRRLLTDHAQGLIHVFEGFFPVAQEPAFAAVMAQIAFSLEGGAATSTTLTRQAVLPPLPPDHPSAYQTPARDTALRRALLDAARVPVQAELGRPFLFLVSTLRTAGDWAFVMGSPLETDGQRFDWMQTPFARDWQADMMSDLVMVLVAHQNGQWRALEHVIGPTDVYWIDWMQSYGLPEALFFGP